MTRFLSNLTTYLSFYFKAFFMGLADIIPGVSGGTIAYATGIYPRLISAISSADKTLLQHVLSLRIKSALKHCDAAFLLIIMSGIVSAIIVFTKILDAPTLIAENTVIFYRICLILMIIVLIQLLRETPPRAIKHYTLIMIGSVAGYGLIHIAPQSWPNSPAVFFLCGAIAITAMILPGISGSFLLVALGKYEALLTAVKEDDFIIIGAFIAGALVGVILTSKLLKKLLAHYEQPTKHCLNGFIMGCTVLLWNYAAL